MSVAQHVARNSAVQLAGRGVTMAVSLAAVSLLSRYLGPERFGDYQFVLAFLLLANLSDFGISTIAIRHLSTLDRGAGDVLGNVLVVRFALATASGVGAVCAALALGYDSEVVQAIAVAVLSYPLMVLSGTYGSLFAANLKMQYATLGNVAQAFVGLVAMAAVAATGGGIIEMVAAYTAGILANALVCIYYARRFVAPALAWDRQYAMRVTREALPLGMAVLLITAYGRLDIVLLRWLTDRDTVGQYGFAYRIVDLAFPLSLFFVGSVFPLLSAFYADGDDGRFRHLYRRSQDLLSIAAIAIVTAVALFAAPIVSVVGGGDYESAVPAMQILSFAIALIWMSNLADHALIAIGRQAALLWIALGGLAVNLTVNLVLIPLYDERGAAIATVVTEFAVLAPALLLVARWCDVAPSWTVVGRMVAIAAVTAMIVLALPLHWAIEACAAGAMFSAGIAAARVVSLSEMRSLFTRDSGSAALPAGLKAAP